MITTNLSRISTLALVSTLLACNNPPPAAEKAPEPKAEVAKPAEPAPAPPPENADLPAPPDVAAPPADAEKTATGLATKKLAPGTGTDHPKSYDQVRVHYTGWTTDGKMFDSSVKRGEPASFSLDQVIAGWSEGLQLMVVGEKRRMWIPEMIAYKGQPGRPQGMLVFDVELLGITPGTPPVPAPADVAAPPADAKKTKSGLAYKVEQKGTGKDKPKPEDKVKVNYTGWFTDGKMFDSSVKRGVPAVFGVSQVIPGWTEGLQLMTTGEKTLFWIPQEIAYNGRPGAPPGMLVFEVELLEIMKQPAPPVTPKDVAAPPKDAKKTASGLAYKVLKKGTGKVHPTPADRVNVHYSGWTTDGKMFDSSVTRGQPITFGVTQVIAGWTEGLQLMVEGDHMRFWIPEELAYKGNPNAPQGMLVFDVELIKIEK